jgi:hypothetical protein
MGYRCRRSPLSTAPRSSAGSTSTRTTQPRDDLLVTAARAQVPIAACPTPDQVPALAIGTSMPGSISAGALAEGRTSMSKISVGMYACRSRGGSLGVDPHRQPCFQRHRSDRRRGRARTPAGTRPSRGDRRRSAHLGHCSPLGFLRRQPLQPHVRGPLLLFAEGLPQRLPAAAAGLLKHRYSDLSRKFKPQTHRARRLAAQRFETGHGQVCGGSR